MLGLGIGFFTTGGVGVEGFFSVTTFLTSFFLSSSAFACLTKSLLTLFSNCLGFMIFLRNSSKSESESESELELMLGLLMLTFFTSTFFFGGFSLVSILTFLGFLDSVDSGLGGRFFPTFSPFPTLNLKNSGLASCKVFKSTLPDFLKQSGPILNLANFKTGVREKFGN